MIRFQSIYAIYLAAAVNVIRDGNKKTDFEQNQQISEILELLKSMKRFSGVNKKIDNISTFLLRMIRL